MIVRRLTVQNYRNIASADIVPDAGVTVFAGDNAQGKTNLLEAIYLCCTGRSHRTARERELIRSGENVARVCVRADSRLGERTVEIALSTSERRRVKVDGAPIAQIRRVDGLRHGSAVSRPRGCALCRMARRNAAALSIWSFRSSSLPTITRCSATPAP